MKVAIGPFTFGFLPMEEAFEKMHQLGFRYHELCGWSGPNSHLDAGKAARDEIRKVGDALDKFDLELVAVLTDMSLASPDEATRKNAVQYCIKAIENTRALGCDLLTAEMSGGSTGQLLASIASFKKSISEIQPTLEHEGVKIAFEPHPGNFMEKSNPTIDLFREIDCDHIRYIYCCPHSFILGDDIGEMIDYAREFLGYVHVADSHNPDRIVASYGPTGVINMVKHPAWSGLTVHEHLVAGHGDIDLKRVFGALKKVGYDGVISAIPFVFTPQGRPVESAEESKRKIEELIASS